MKNIIVPTDFSKNSVNALKYAIKVANQFGSVIHLVNGIDNISAVGIYSDVGKMINETAMISLSDVVNKVSGTLVKPAIIISKTLRGETISAICDYGVEVNADLIIMGTQGASGLKEVFIGTTAQGVIKKAKVPVLVIPSDAKFGVPQHISFALDDKEISSAEIVEPLKELTKAFKANLTVFHFNKQYAMTNIDPSIDDYFNDLEYTVHDHFSDDHNVNNVINNFVKQEGIDLLVMIRRHRSFLSSLFHKSVTSKEVFHSPVPLLILHDHE